jgi:hypothetical protein
VLHFPSCNSSKKRETNSKCSTRKRSVCLPHTHKNAVDESKTFLRPDIGFQRKGDSPNRVNTKGKVDKVRLVASGWVKFGLNDYYAVHTT